MERCHVIFLQCQYSIRVSRLHPQIYLSRLDRPAQHTLSSPYGVREPGTDRAIKMLLIRGPHARDRASHGNAAPDACRYYGAARTEDRKSTTTLHPIPA